MNEFNVPATDEAIAYLRRIAAEMVALFGIPASEAIGRIGYFWRSESFVDERSLVSLLHQEPQHWAKTIYYGRKLWWLDDPPPEPAPYG
jgi:hypothetical protein